MTIGHLVPMNNGKEGEDYRKWLQLILQPVGMNRISCTFHENKKKDKDNQPDFILYENIQRKGDLEKFGKPFRTRSIGSGFRKSSGSGVTYISCVIETPLVYGGKLYFSLFQAKPYEGESEEDIFWLYDAVWQPFQKQQNDNSYSNQNNYAEPSMYTSSPNGGQIPVEVQNNQGRKITADELSEYFRK